MTIVSANTALRLKADLDFVDSSGNQRVAGDEWLFEGPGKNEKKTKVKFFA